MPITWRNVNAPTATGASRILDAAGRSANTGLNQLSNLAQQVTSIGNRNQANQNRINTEAALGGIAGLGSFDALDQARQSGQFDPSNLPAGTDLTQVRQALANRGNVIDDTLSKEAAFAGRQLGREEAPARQDFANLLAAGDVAGAREVNQGFQDTATGANQIARRQADAQAAFRKERAFQEDRTFKQGADVREQNKLQTEFDNKKALIEFEDRLTKAPKETVGAEGSKQIGGHLDRLTAAAPNETLFGNSPFGDAGADSGGREGRALVAKGIESIKSKYGRDVPAEVVSQAVDQAINQMTGSNDTLTEFDNSYSPDDILRFIDDIMKQDPKGDAKIRNKASELQKEQELLQNRLELSNKDRRTRFPGL